MKDPEFEQLVRQYEKLVFTVCYQLVRDYHEAQNLTQETFLSAYRHIDEYQGDSYKPWLIRIASNKAKDYLKSAYFRRVDITDEMESKVSGAEASAEELAVSSEMVKAIQDKILSLEEPYHKVAVLFFLHGLTPEEIAQKLDRPRKTVQTQLYRAKLKLQQFVKEEMQVERSI
ncbi:MAG: sigma-70 family RNA polymerase sigma factor [Oscillospiraceae bacterium]|nr:sigma-70 family RNA polymerase sigma factor [Oscillospiraceae bacterium]